jgi:hypothetical protein
MKMVEFLPVFTGRKNILAQETHENMPQEGTLL